MPITSPHRSCLPYPEHPLWHYLRISASRWPDRTAMIDGDREISFRGLDRESDRIAFGLIDAGIRQGERVALMAPNSIEFAVSFFGILKAGAVVTPTNNAWKAREIGYQLENAEARLFLYDAMFHEEVRALPKDQANLRRLVIADHDSRTGDEAFESFGSDAPQVEFPTLTPDDLAALPYSSGTTGLPKGVMLSHANLVANVEQTCVLTEGIDVEEVSLNHLPYFHIYGMTCLLVTPIVKGGLQVIMRRFEMGLFLSLLERYRPTTLLTVPAVLQGLLSVPNLDSLDFSTIQFCSTGAAPLPPEIARQIRERTGIPVRQGYGLTETSPVANITIPGKSRIETIGPPVSDTEEKIVDMEDPTKELPVGETGELAIKGPQVMQGYWKAPEESERVLEGGWFLTGDIAIQEPDDTIRIVDRKKEMIKYKGFPIAPAEIEATLLEHAAVKDCAVVSAKDPEVGEYPKAFVVLDEQVPAPCAQELITFVSERIASYKKPRAVEFLDQIPRNPAGKILRRVLAERESEQG